METYEADPIHFAQSLGQDVVGEGNTVFYIGKQIRLLLKKDSLLTTISATIQ